MCKTSQRARKAAESSKAQERPPDRLLRWRERLNHLFPPLPIQLSPCPPQPPGPERGLADGLRAEGEGTSQRVGWMLVAERRTPAAPQSRAGITEPAERRQGIFHQQETVRAQQEGEVRQRRPLPRPARPQRDNTGTPQADVTLGHGRLLWGREKNPWLKGNGSPKMESLMLNPQQQSKT